LWARQKGGSAVNERTRREVQKSRAEGRFGMADILVHAGTDLSIHIRGIGRAVGLEQRDGGQSSFTGSGTKENNHLLKGTERDYCLWEEMMRPVQS